MNTRQRIAFRHGYTVKELIAVVVVVFVLAALLLPATRSAREPARRTQCANNLKQLGLACHNYESTYGKLPTGGIEIELATLAARLAEGKTPRTIIGKQSTFTAILLFMEGGTLVANYDWSRPYNDAAAPSCKLPGSDARTFNEYTAKQKIPGFQCLSNPFTSVLDPVGFGMTDYMPITYTDIDPKPDASGVIGMRNRATTAAGCLSVDGTLMSDILDGTSNTIMIAESAGRLPETARPWMCGEFDDELCAQGKGVANACTKTGRRAFWRWAEPTSAGGISGQRNNSSTRIFGYVNGNKAPLFGGSAMELRSNGNCLTAPLEGTNARCYWSWTNCGPNDEIFSWHNAGAQVVMADGGVKLLGNNIRPEILRYLITRREGIDLPNGAVF